ncbi:negative elongation factor D-like [Watersipora subatra]|uniref:negative elongation factor D-like n=1 Tax=Watersipora subatra TaxID=2589382 RepID=UPI00355BF9B9
MEYENMSDDENEYNHDEHDEHDDEATRQDCIDKFSIPDFIMEPDVFITLQRYFKAGGLPEQVVDLLSNHYQAMAQTANLLAEWLILAGTDIHTVQELVETHLKDMILKHFDTKKADAIFTDGETPEWLQEMIEFPTWRMLFYKLAEEYPDCLMLNFTIKLISDAGYQGEITSVSTACHQLEVFSRVLKTSVSSYLNNTESFLKDKMQDFAKMVCHGEHTYLYTQILLYTLSQESKGGPKAKRLSQELQLHAKQRGLDVTAITSSVIGGSKHARACQAVAAMMSKGSINPADVTTLHTAFTSPDPPPVEMIRNPTLLNLFIDGLFMPGVKINPDYKTKYLHILAYATTVAETYKKGVRKSFNKEDLNTTFAALEKTQKICSENKAGQELVGDLPAIFEGLKYPVVAKGVLIWVTHIVTEAKYFVRNTDHNPIHLILLDEISSCQHLLHGQVQALLVKLFESSHEDVDVLVQLDLKKTLLDRMVHLVSRGYVLPICTYIKNCFQRQTCDISLIRHYVTEVLDIIAPPYTQEFVDVMYPLVNCSDITSTLRNDTSTDAASHFLSHCQKNYSLDKGYS